MTPEQWAPLPPPPAPLEPEQRGPIAKPKNIFQRAGGALVAAVLAALKFGWLIIAGLGKVTFLFSFLVSIWVYALFFGWRFGVGFVLLLLVHEMGHVIQLRREGVKA